MMKIYDIFLMVSVMPSLVTTLKADASNLPHICNETLVMNLDIQMSEVRLLKIFQNDTDTLIGSLDGKKGNWSTVSEHKDRLSFGTTVSGIKISLNNISSSAFYKCVITFNTGTFTVIDWNVLFYDKDTLDKTMEITLENKEPISQVFICRRTQVDCYVFDESFKCIQQPTPGTIYREDSNHQTVIVAVAVPVTLAIVIAVGIGIFCYLRKRNRTKRKAGEKQDKVNQENAEYYIHQNTEGSVFLKENPSRLKPAEKTQPLIEETYE